MPTAWARGIDRRSARLTEGLMDGTFAVEPLSGTGNHTTAKTRLANPTRGNGYKATQMGFLPRCPEAAPLSL